MKKLAITMALIGLSCGAAQADTTQFSPASQSAPLSTTAMFTFTNFNLIPGTQEAIEVGFNVTSGPDVGQNVSFVTFCFRQCAFTFDVQNNGMSGIDSIEGHSSSLSNGTFGSASGTITWTASGVPAPSSLLLVGVGLAAAFIVRRRPGYALGRGRPSL